MRIVLVNYLNSRPFLRGLQKYAKENNFEIIEAYPAECAEILKSGKADVGLIPVGAFNMFEDYKIISDYCIGCIGAVKTVAIYSDSPIEQAEKVLLDYQSLTSVKLAQILLKEYWELDLIYEKATPGYEQEIGENEAGVIIGDRTAAADKRYNYKYDLGEVWYKMTGLPFCFAAWVTEKEISSVEMKQLNIALKYGMSIIPEIISQEKQTEIDLSSYFSKYIDFTLDKDKSMAINLFNKRMKLRPAQFMNFL